MTLARLDLLGGFRLTSSEGQASDVGAKKNRALLGILAMAPRHEASRGTLTALLWSDRSEEQAKSSLRQALVSLRKDLAALGSEVLVISGEQIALDPTGIALDVAEFLSLSASSDLAELKQAANLYAGPFLDGLSTTDNAFEEWLRGARADLFARAVRAIERLAVSLTGSERVAMAERLVALDPLREASHLGLMHAYIAQGQSALAIKQYETCRLLLKRELSVDPNEELQQLRASLDSAPLPSRQKPAIAVLPFEDAGGDPERQSLGDGIADDLITELGRFREVRVTARNSSFALKGKHGDAKSIGRLLSADYLLEGSVRLAGNTVRITAQLSETESGNQIWSDRYDRELTDIFEVQRDTAINIAIVGVGAVRSAIAEKLRRRPITQLDVDELYLRARVLVSCFETTAQAEPLLVRALELDPDIAAPHALLAVVLVIKWFQDDNPETLKAALAHGRRAVSLGPLEALSYSSLGLALLYMGQPDEALVHLDHGVKLSPYDVFVRSHRAVCRNYLGRYQEALSDIEVSLARDPRSYDWHWDIRGQILVALGRYQDAITSYRNLNVFGYWAYAYLAVCHWRLGDADKAKVAVRECLAARPSLTVNFLLSDPYRDREFVERMRTDLLAVGLPEG